MKFKTTYSQYCSAGTGKLLRTGAGEVHALIFTTSNIDSESVIIYDNTAGSGNILIKLNLTCYTPIGLEFLPEQALKFSTGLYVSTGTNVVGFVILAY